MKKILYFVFVYFSAVACSSSSPEYVAFGVSHFGTNEISTTVSADDLVTINSFGLNQDETKVTRNIAGSYQRVSTALNAQLRMLPRQKPGSDAQGGGPFIDVYSDGLLHTYSDFFENTSNDPSPMKRWLIITIELMGEAVQPVQR